MSPIRPNPCPISTPPVKPTEARAGRTWLVQDQRPVATRTDVLSYQTPLLDHAVRVEGAPFADLFAKTTGTDADFVVKIIDVYPPDVAEQPEMGGYQLPSAWTSSAGATARASPTPRPSPPASPGV